MSLNLFFKRILKKICCVKSKNYFCRDSRGDVYFQLKNNKKFYGYGHLNLTIATIQAESILLSWYCDFLNILAKLHSCISV